MKNGRVPLLLLTAVLLMSAATKETCPMGPFPLQSTRDPQRALYHAASQTAELVAPNAFSSGRHRIVGPVPAPAPAPPVVNFIDVDLFAKAKQDGVRITVVSGDEEFLRRVTLDLTGQIPDAAGVQAFLADQSADKRTKKIDELLASDAFVDRWTMWFGDLVQNVQSATNIREYYEGRNAYYAWIRDSIRAGKPYDQMVRELVAGGGDSFALGPPNFIVRQLQGNGPIQDTYDNLAAQSGERFLGMPLLCLSCHNGLGHLELVNQYLQTKQRYDFWKMAAFFSRTKPTSAPGDPDNTNVKKWLITDNTTGHYNLNTTSGNKTPRAPAPGQPAYVTPAYLFTGEQPRDGEAWREAYGRMLTADPQFARAAVNYVWKEMFGIAIVEPTNAFDLLRLDPATLPAGQTLQPTNPQLLNDLTGSFRAGGYSLRGLLRTMAMSSSYQLASVYSPAPWNEAWTPYFVRHLPHRLTAEATLDAIARATNVLPAFTVSGVGTVTKAMALPDTTESKGNAYGRFLDEFGRGDRDQTARTNDSSMAQSLGMMNDSTVVVARIHAKTANSTVAKIVASTTDPASVADQLYVATLSRHPTAAEKQTAISYLTVSANPGTLSQKTEDLQWVLLNELEFLFD